MDSSREDRIKYFERHIAELKKSAKQNVDKIEKQREKTEQAQVEVEVLRNELLQMEGKEQDSEDLSYPFFVFLWLWLKTKQTKKSQGSSVWQVSPQIACYSVHFVWDSYQTSLSCGPRNIIEPYLIAGGHSLL